MTGRLVTELLHAGSRLKRSIHRATAPRTPVPRGGRRAEDVDDLVDLFFPGGVDADSLAVVRGMLQAEHLDASSVRRALGHVDQQRSPTPFTVRMTNDDVAFVAVDGIEVTLDRADRSVSAPIIAEGHWEPHIERVLRRFLAPGSVFVDIGANVGWHTALASSIVGAAGVVHAFEPNPANARLIAHTIEHNGLTNVRLLPFALGERMGFASFRSAIGSNGGFADTGTDLLDPAVTIVPTLRFDDLGIERVDVVKIDVEGAEPIALRGAEAMIERDHPVIVFEFSCEMTERVGGVAARDHLEMFGSHGYQLSIIDRETGELDPVSGVDDLLRDWGDYLRIEDLVATPSSAGLR